MSAPNIRPLAGLEVVEKIGVVWCGWVPSDKVMSDLNAGCLRVAWS